MIIVNDHVLLTAVIAGAVGLYMIEMLFFWTRWNRLSMRMDQEGGAHGLIQELQAEVDVLAEEVAGLRRQLTRFNDVENFPQQREPMPHSAPAPAAKPRSYPPASSIPAPANAAPHPAPRSMPLRQEPTHSQHPQHAQHPQERPVPPRPPSSQPPSSSNSGFSRGIEVLHRRVVELARTGMDSAAIATECQLSQTETELILSLNGIKRTS